MQISCSGYLRCNPDRIHRGPTAYGEKYTMASPSGRVGNVLPRCAQGVGPPQQLAHHLR